MTKTVHAPRKVSTKSANLPPQIVRWYAQTPKVFAALVAVGVNGRHVYEGWKPGEHWEKITMRTGEGLGVIDGLRAFGGKVAIKKAIARFHGHGAAIVDCKTGQDSRTHGIAMFDAATGPRKPSADYDKASKDAAADARRTANGQMRKHDAHAVWFSPTLKIAEKINLTGWSKGSLYKAFNKSNGVTGRPPKQTEA